MLAAAPATATAVTDVSNCEGSTGQYIVPTGATAMHVVAIGAHGGTNDNAADGGNGGSVDVVIPVSPGDVVDYGIGCYGGGHGGAGFGGANGGDHGVANSGLAYDGGGGGGATGLAVNGGDAVVAGGGGGGGGYSAIANGSGSGGDGGSPAHSGHDGTGSTAPDSSGGCGGCQFSAVGGDGGGSSTHSAGGGGGGGGGGWAGGGGGEGGNDFAGLGAGGGGGLSYVWGYTIGTPTFGHGDLPGNGSLTVTWLATSPGAIETATSVVSSANPSVAGQGVTFTASISLGSPQATQADAADSPPFEGIAINGSVQFSSDGTPFGNPVAVVDGTAVSPELTNLAVGQHTISAVFTSSGDNPGSTGTLTQVVNPVAAPIDAGAPAATSPAVATLAESGSSITPLLPIGALSLVLVGVAALVLVRSRLSTEEH